jgi:hypothetical protein
LSLGYGVFWHKLWKTLRAFIKKNVMRRVSYWMKAVGVSEILYVLVCKMGTEQEDGGSRVTGRVRDRVYSTTSGMSWLRLCNSIADSHVKILNLHLLSPSKDFESVITCGWIVASYFFAVVISSA